MQRDGTLITNQRYMHVDWLITRHFITNRRSRYTKKRIETGQRCVGERSPILLNIIGVSIDKSRGKPISKSIMRVLREKSVNEYTRTG